MLLLPLCLFFTADTLFVSDTLPSVNDAWLAEDKFWHFGMSLALVGSSYHFFKCRLKKGEKAAVGLSLGGTFTFGLFKEFWDRRKPKGYFSYRDIVANLLGIGLGYLIFIYD